MEYQINDLVYLSMKNLALPKHRAQKLIHKFIGPYKVLKVMNNSLNITIKLPQEFRDQRINPTFHTSLVQPYIKNNDILFPKRDTKVYYEFGNNKDQEWLVEEILAHKWTNDDLEFQVKWMAGDIIWFKSSYWGQKISKSTSVDCNKIYIVTVKSKKIMGIAGQFPHYSYTVGPYGKGPTGNYTTCTYIASKYTVFSINNDRYLITWP